MIIVGSMVRNAWGRITLRMAFAVGQAKASGRLHLPFVHGFNTSSDNLRHIGARIQAQGHTAGRERPSYHIPLESIRPQHAPHAIVHDEYLYQQRRPSYDVNVDIGNEF